MEDLTCTGECLDRSEPDARGRTHLTGTRRYPLAKVCCALAHLAEAPTSAHRAVTLRVIRAQLGADHEATVRKAWDSLRAGRKASGSDPSPHGPD